jgi:hypothetical protein
MVSRSSFLAMSDLQSVMTSNTSFLTRPTNRKVMSVSLSLWCDINDTSMNAPNMIGHAFSGNDPDKHHYSDTRPVEYNTGNSFGRPTYQTRDEVTDEYDMCGYHWNRRNPFKANTEAIAPPAPTIEELEKETNDYQKGFTAGVDHALYGIGSQ